MSTTGIAGFFGAPPKVEVVRRMLRSQIPEDDLLAFEAYVVVTRKKIEYTKSGEAVYQAKDYEEWKASQ